MRQSDPKPYDTTAMKMRDNDTPCVHFYGLEALWFQVAGTICNLQCHHCFISCGPDNDRFKFLSFDTCARYLEESKALGVKAFYFTGGEPFANPEMVEILELALRCGSTTVLTNATLFRDAIADRLETIAAAARFPLEIRVSLDGYNAEMNDAVRGAGTFDRAISGVRALVTRGFCPIMTITRTWDGCDDEVLSKFTELLRDMGYAEPRLKVLPRFLIGAEARRTNGYGEQQRITPCMMEGFDPSNLMCRSARIVTDQGVWVCPILLDELEAKVGDTLAESFVPFPLRYGACHTCWQHGAVCTNEGSTSVCDAST